jgi:hypothetical protein
MISAPGLPPPGFALLNPTATPHRFAMQTLSEIALALLILATGYGFAVLILSL